MQKYIAKNIRNTTFLLASAVVAFFGFGKYEQHKSSGTSALDSPEAQAVTVIEGDLPEKASATR